MQKQKTVVEVFTEACAAFYRAITELDQVAIPRGGDLQHEAHKATGALQKTLDAAINDWNHEEELPHVSLCAGADSLESWADGCEKYAAGLATGGYCPACSRAKDAAAERAYDRQQERLMEDGGVDDSAYRRDMKDAGRGHLLA